MKRTRATALSAATERAYSKCVRNFVSWCEANRFRSLPASAQTVALYVLELGTTRLLSTVQQSLWGIGLYHEREGFKSPCAAEIVEIARLGVAKHQGIDERGKDALTHADLLRTVAAISDHSVVGLRNRALLHFGFAMAAQRSMIPDLRVEDLRIDSVGLTIVLRGKGDRVFIDRAADPIVCPVRAIEAYIAAVGMREGPLFLSVADNSHTALVPGRPISPSAYSNVVKKAARKAGLHGDFAAHSLRVGFVVDADKNGAALRAIQSGARLKKSSSIERYLPQFLPEDPPALAAITGGRG